MTSLQVLFSSGSWEDGTTLCVTGYRISEWRVISKANSGAVVWNSWKCLGEHMHFPGMKSTSLKCPCQTREVSRWGHWLGEKKINKS